VAASSSERLLFLAASLLGGCTLGVGDGAVTGTVNDPECGLENWALDLDPSFFVADRGVEGLLEIRVQKGSNFEDRSNGIIISVLDAEEIKTSMLGLPIDFAQGDASPVRMGLYLNAKCEPDPMDGLPLNLTAVSGTIAFTSIYAPNVDGEKEIAASFTDVFMTDLRDPDTRNATISGQFSFIFNRGRPAQRFP
jgi:hypothetical protein